VALVERTRAPRTAAILLVYAVTLSALYAAGAAVAPRLYRETATLVRDLPSLGHDLSLRWGPRAERWVKGLVSRKVVAPIDTEQAALEVTPTPDGSFEVRVRGGLDVIQESPTHWRITPQQPDSLERFTIDALVQEGIDSTASYLKRNALELIRVGQVIVKAVSRGIFLLFLTLMMAAYLLHSQDQIIGFFRGLAPSSARPSFDRLLRRVDRGLAGVVRGQLLICVVNGILSAIGFWLFDLKYWPVLAMVAAALSIIPIFGAILSSVPAVAIGLTQDFFTALWVLLWIIGIHQVEANLLNPKIIGVAAKIHPVLVVTSLLIGEHFFGLWGALLAVPTLSLGQSLFLHLRHEVLPDDVPDSMPSLAAIPERRL
jgi:predicted PurR-regulated permease PerM